jgi:hypothetical protein
VTRSSIAVSARPVRVAECAPKTGTKVNEAALVVRAVIDGMRADGALSDPARWVALTRALQDAGYKREAAIAARQSAVQAAELTVPGTFGVAGTIALLDAIERRV